VIKKVILFIQHFQVMNNIRLYKVSILAVLITSKIFAQDPHFTQFTNTPLLTNPAQIGVFSNPFNKDLSEYLSLKSSIYCNYRSQWMGSASSFNTGSLLYQMRFGDATVNERGYYRKKIFENPINLGVGVMFDQSLNGILKGNFLTMAGSYHLSLSETDGGGSSLGIGANVTYASRTFDLSRTSFSQQFTSGGFDLSIPNGEAAITNMKPYLSLGAGLLYSFRDESEVDFLKIGISVFNLNKPKQTFVNDENQFLKQRIVFNTSWTHRFNKTRIESQILYQNQGKVNELATSLYYDIFISSDKSIGFGFFYRYHDAIAPCLRLDLNKFLITSSYDITSSNLKNGLKPSKSVEFSLQYFFNQNGE